MDPGSIPGGDRWIIFGLSWSSGLGRHPLTVEIEGSSPSGSGYFILVTCYMDQKSFKSSSNNQSFWWQKKTFWGQNKTDKGGNNMSAFKAKVIYVNDQIKAPNVMIIDDNKTNLWVFPRRVALEMANEKWLDLVQLTYDPDKMLSTVRLTDYGKYMYQKWKEEKERRKSQKWKDTKELKVSYSIWENDLQLKVKKAQEILQWWDNVKFSIRLKWRERMYAEKAVQKLEAIQWMLVDFWKTQYDTPRKEANWYSIILFSK